MASPPPNAEALAAVANRNLADPWPWGNQRPKRSDYRRMAAWGTDGYWYAAESGEVMLYRPADDGIMYFWRFASAGDVSLIRHGFIVCG